MSPTVPSHPSLEQAAALLGPLAERNAPLGPRTTYRVGGEAALLVVCADRTALARVAEAVDKTGVPVLVVGRGSNLLVADSGFAGLCVVLGSGFATLAREGPTVVSAGGAVSYPSLARASAAWGLAGMEWAVGIPGSVGGAVRMNAGGHGAETAERLLSATLVDLESGDERLVDRPALAFSYRRSAVSSREVVVSARFGLEDGTPSACEARIGEVVAWRRANQPPGRNAGSVFKNPPGDTAGRLVEEAGAKGMRQGSARVSERHANFILVDPHGSADDVARLVEAVRQLVAERLGVHLETEVELVGFST